VSVSQVSVCLSGGHGFGLDVLLPHLGGVVAESAEVAGGRVRIRARVRAPEGVCPRCGQVSVRVHSTYVRRLADLPAGGQLVVIWLAVRRFFCGNPGCRAVTFAEQAEGLTARRARRTVPAAVMLTRIGLALAGRAGARLAAALGLAAGRAVLLRLVMALPDPPAEAVKVLGVDDFAFRRRRTYGTVLVNAETGRPVDLLADREADTLADWLKAHPGTEVICRDRAGAYADGARRGAPGAVQAADRWHLYHNLAQHVDKAAARHRACLKDPEPGPGDGAGSGNEAGDGAGDGSGAGDGARAAGIRARYEQVRELRGQGLGIRPIARQTGLHRDTVRRICRAGSAGELLARVTDGRPSILDQHKPYLNQRWAEGCADARQLHAEITARGYPGSYETLCRYLRPFRAGRAAPPARPLPPKTRDVARWILTDPARLDDQDTAKLAAARQRCPHLDALAGHVTEFAKILTGLHGDRLDHWITAVEADDQPDLHSFARGLRHDHDAVTTGLTQPWNSGTVEGNVNRIKMIKRQMYGRASFELLRKRVLLAT
jgi:transposase